MKTVTSPVCIIFFLFSLLMIATPTIASPTDEKANPTTTSTTKDDVGASLKYGIIVQRLDAGSWAHTLLSLRQLLCTGDAIHIDCVDTSVFSANEESDGTRFVVSLTEAWPMYDLLDLPAEELQPFAILSITSAVQLPALSKRGPNQVQLKMFTTQSSGDSATPNTPVRLPFSVMRKQILSQLVAFQGDVNVSVMGLAFANYTFNEERQGYNAEMIVTFKDISQQVEIAWIDWQAMFNAKVMRLNLVSTMTSELYPVGVDLDETTTKMLQHRVRFDFTNTVGGGYLGFTNFAQNLQSIFLWQWSKKTPLTNMTLVKAHATANDTTLSESFTVSFATAEEQQEILHSAEQQGGLSVFSDRGYHVTATNVTARVTNAPTTTDSLAPTTTDVLTTLTTIETQAPTTDVPQTLPTNEPATDAPTTTDAPISPAPTSNPTPGEWGQGYAEYDLYNNAQCSGTPMPGARTLGCFKSMEGQCVSSTEVSIRSYHGPFNATCHGPSTMKTITAGQCVPAPGSDGSLYIKAKSCAKTGAVPMQIDVGYCTDTYSNNDCSGDLQLSECYAINTCLSSNQQYSIKFTCTTLQYHSGGEQQIYHGTTCDGNAVYTETSVTNKCSKGEWLRSCSDEAPTTSSPDATTPVTNEPATPVPAPTLPAGSAWGFLVKLTANDTWSNTRYTLRKRLCGGGYSGTYTCLPGYPDYDLVPANDEGKADEFVVSVNQSWMMYDAISIPQYVLEANDVASISALGDVPTAITERGENLVLLKTFTSYDYGNPELKAWKSFRQLRNNAMNTIVGGTNTSDMALVFANYSYNASRDGYEATLIVSMKKLSQQVELAGINWEALSEALVITSSYVVGASLYPLGVDLDQTTANQLDNRVEFNFTNKNNDYTTFSSFANNLDDVFRVKGSMDVDPQSMRLVKSVATVNDTKIEQSFTVSFEKEDQQREIIAIAKNSGMSQMGWSYQSQSVAYAASPALITPTPTKQSGGGATGDDDGDKSKPKTTLIVVVVVVVLVVVAAVVAVGLKMSSKKRNTVLHFEEVINSDNSAVLEPVSQV